MDTGRQWFLHAVFSVKSRNLVIKQNQFQHQIDRRELHDDQLVGGQKRGTNIAPLWLNFHGEPIQENRKKDKLGGSNGGQGQGQVPLVAALIGLGIFLLIGIFILVIFIRHRRKRASPPPTPSGTITVMSTSTGQTRVISNAHIFKSSELTEV